MRYPYLPDGEPQKYLVDLITAVGLHECLVEGCRGRAANRAALRVNFFHRHVRDTVVILEEVNLTHPRCPCF